jgi:phenylpropionate dioxygenase-like ring-hydroxylating dioxygenase large terminal subunit
MSDLEPRLTPPETRPHVSVARLPDYWYIACRSGELGKKPLARSVLGIPLAIFRNRAGAVGALLDRCPHRNVPLSQGTLVESGHLECRYHGWQFDTTGACRFVPGLCGSGEHHGRRAEAFPVREQDGFVWVYGRPDTKPEREPFPLPLTAEPGYTTVVRDVDVEASVHAAAENALDVPHTAYLHRGLFRGGQKNKIEAIVRRWGDRVEAEYQGEPRPPGVVGRLLSPSGGTVEHWDRFFLPSIAQVEYRLGSENHILVTTAMTPLADFRTRMYAVISFRVRLPGRVVKLVLEPLAMRIFRQDAEILRVQTETIRRFGGEQFMSTDVDVLGREIWRLLRQAERGEIEPMTEEPVTRRLELMV